jgi:hexosaminidase
MTLNCARIFVCMFACSLVLSASAGQKLNLVPLPNSVTMEAGEQPFALDAGTRVYVERGSEASEQTAAYLADVIGRGTGFQFEISKTDSPTFVSNGILLTTKNARTVLGKEGYELEVTEKGVVIRAPQAAGLFYGVQTLRQLLPAAIYGAGARTEWTVPCLKIMDAPRFTWRGLHLDVARQFHDVTFIKRYLDNMAMHKLNVFHWHLTDDQGWRIEIKKHPKLTEKGPFYTQDEIREIVAYAAQRHITVLPEIDVPAHCRAVTARYPELLCDGEPHKYGFGGVAANTLCAAKEGSYTFVDEVLAEIVPLFPCEYVHMGGDERPQGIYEQCESCQKTIKDRNLRDANHLQDHFECRVQKMLRKHGKKMMGWDELLHGTDLEKDYVVMTWNRPERGVDAAKLGYRNVMSPAPFNYFDLAYSEDPSEPGLRWAGVVSVEKTYSFDPRPTNVNAEVADRVFGVHGCLWGAQPKPDYMLFPRLCALAEVGWTPQAQRDWPGFWRRLTGKHFARLDIAGIKYRIPPATAELRKDKIVINPPYEGAIVRYTIDNGDPITYTTPFETPFGSDLGITTSTSSGRASRVTHYRYSLTTGQKVTASKNSASGAYAVDGKVFGNSYWEANHAPQWLMVTLASVSEVSSADLVSYWDGGRYYQYRIEVSMDAENWTEVVDMSENTSVATQKGYHHDFKAIPCRYVRVTMLKNSANPGLHIVEFHVVGPKDTGQLPELNAPGNETPKNQEAK